MEILGLNPAIWLVLAVYFAAMILMGWLARRRIHDQNSYLLGDRVFNIWYMVMHAFGAGTNPGDVAGVVSKSVDRGAAGVWVSWMWLFGTPFYWIIAPIVRRLRAVTMADYFEQRYGGYSSVLYVLLATLGMIMCLASVLLATTRTVQGGLPWKARITAAWMTTPDLSSAAPRPYSRPSRSVGSNGGLCHRDSSPAGCTS